MKQSTHGKKFIVLCSVLMALCLAFSTCLLAACNPAEQAVSGNEVGVYYYQPTSQSREDVVTLSEGLIFTLNIGNEVKSGRYLLENGNLTLTSGETVITAKLENNVITLNYNGTEMKFLKKLYYTVTFNTMGGSDIASIEILNGKTLSKPSADPTKEGSIFLGWYADQECKTPYTFGTPVSGDITLYARWAQIEEGATEYTVNFNFGNGQTTSVTTIGGRLFDLPVAEMDGMKFVGWWMSMTNNGDKLTASVSASTNGQDGTLFTADTTLFAVWQPNDAATQAPAVNVATGSISWNSVGSAAYLLTIIAPDGTAVYNNYRTTTTTFPFTFDQTGEYKVEVTAINAGGTAVSDTTVRYFTNNALNRVSGVKVMEPSILVFRGVENAEEYILTIECGDELHTHTLFNNSTSLYYNFANCQMKKGGIKFTITAAADGFASSETVFTYERNLEAVENVAINNDILSWDAVEGANYYIVSDGSEEIPVFGTELSLKNMPAGQYTFSVTAVASGFNSHEATTLEYNKTTLALPENISLSDKTLGWTASADGQSYQILVNGKAVDVEEGQLSYDLTSLFTWSDGESYTIQLKVINGNASALSDEIEFICNEMGSELTYEAGILSWKPVAGALNYEVMLNGKVVETITNGNNFYKFDTLGAIGENTLQVRFSKDGYTSEWETITVTANRISLYVGEIALDPLYKAVGDPIELPEVESPVGREFYAWYNTPNGPESNGALFDQPFFAGSSELVLYAYFQPKTYTVNFADADGINATTVKYGSDFTFAVPVSTDATEVFGGWYSAPNGNGYAYTDANGKSLSAWGIAQDDITVYAYWIEGALSYSLAGNSYIVSSGARINLVESVTVPATYNGLAVTGLSSSAFVGCSLLKEINLPNTLETIPSSAFDGCSALEAVNIYDAEALFARYSSSDGVLFDSGAADNQHAPRVVFVPSAKTGTYTIPYGVDIITRLSFANSSISKVVIPSSVKTIETEAFADCLNLSAVVFENLGASGTLTIGDRAFKNCEALTTITLPARLSEISLQKYDSQLGDVFSTSQLAEFAADAFYGCDNLVSISVAESVNAIFTSADGVLFKDNGRTLVYFPTAKTASNYELPAGVTEIANGAFVNSALTGTLTLPARITKIGEFAFAGTRISKLVFAGTGLSNVEVANYAFFGCDSLWSVTFEAGSLVSKLGKGAFMECTDLEEFEVPASMTEIGTLAFYCEYDDEDYKYDFEISFAESTNPITLGDKLFYGREFYTLEIPANAVVSAGVLSGVTFNYLEVAEGNTYLAAQDHMDSEEKVGTAIYLKNAEGQVETLLKYESDYYSGDYTFDVPVGVKTIASGAFIDVGSISTVTIPGSVTLIDARAFYNTELETITFADDGTEKLTIGEGAFYGPYGGAPITSIVLPSREVEIGNEAFAENGDLETLDLGGTISIGDRAFTETGSDLALTIPNTVQSIGFEAFAGSYSHGIVSVAFEADSTLKTIGANAFADSKITTITIPASVETIGAAAFRDSSLTELLFEEGDLPLAFGVAHENSVGNVIYGTDITTINFPGRLTELSERALAVGYSWSDPQAVTVTFGNQYQGFNESKLTTIGAYAFENLGLTSITIPKSVQNTDVIAIGNNAFDACSLLQSVTFEAGGTGTITIGASAFVGCNSLESITLPANLGNFTAADGTVTAALANGVGVFIPDYGTSDSKLASIEVADGNAIYASANGMLYSSDFTTLIFCPPAKSGVVTIDKRTETVGSNAFLSCSAVTEINFEEGSVCTEIEANAFESCSDLTTITLSDSLEKIGADAFLKCSSLTSLELPESFNAFSTNFLTDYITSITVSENSQFYKSVDNVIYSKDGKVLVYSMSDASDFIVPEGTEVISENAFGGSIATLQSVTLPASLVEIGDNAFSSCTSLASVTFADNGVGALVIGDSAFNNTAITEIALPARTISIGDDVFGSTDLASVDFGQGSQLTSIGSRAFMGTAITKIVLPESVIELGDNVFYNCYQLKTFTATGSLVEMGNGVFGTTSSGASSLTTVVLPATLKTIGEKTFLNCDKLTSVTFGDNSQLEVLPANTFYGCVALQSFEIPANITVLEGRDPEYTSVNEDNTGLFYGLTSLKKVTFAPNSKCAEIGYSVFEESGLEEFEIPASVTKIGGSAFAYTNLSEIVIPRTVTHIGTYLFNQAKQLTSATLESAILTLPNGTFNGCEALQYVYLPASVSEISASAFSGCSALEGIDLDSANTSFVADEDGVLFNSAKTAVAFLPASLTHITIPATLVSEDIIDLLKSHGSLEAIEVEEGNALYVSYFGAMYTNTEEDGLVLTVIPNAMTVFTIPKEIDYFFGYGLFSDSNVTEVTYEERTTDLNLTGSWSSGAFTYASNLTKVTLPANTTIGNYAFRGSSKLETVIMEAGSSGSIGNYAFAETAITELTIAEGYTSLGTNVFANSALTTLNLPQSMQELSTSTFTNATNLSTITVASGNANFLVEDGILYSADKSELFFLPATLTTFEIPKEYTSTSIVNLLKALPALESITVAEGNTAFVVAYNALYSSDWQLLFVPKALTTFTIAKDLEELDGRDKLFEGTAITTVTFEEGRTKTLNLSGSSSYGVFYGANNLTEVTLPEGTYIGDYAFCKTTSITRFVVPQGAYVGDSSFQGWTSDQTLVLPFAEGVEPDETLGWNGYWDWQCNAMLEYTPA